METMTMNGSSSPYVSADEVEGIPAVTSSGSCVLSVTSNGGCGNDVASVGSSSTKTRFSFYNAQEVQLDEQNQTTVVVTTTTSPTSSRGAPRREEETAKSTPTKSGRTESNTRSGTQSSNSATSPTTDQRFNFYEADGDSSPKTSKTEDDRRSPHTLSVNEEDKNDNKRTPAAHVVVSETTAAAAVATPNNKPVLSVKTATPQATTPQRNNTLSSSALKKKQRAVQAAAARSRSHKPEGIPTPLATNKDKSSSSKHSKAKGQVSKEDDPGNMDSVEILRSLKDTEQMRYNLMKECHPKHSSANDADSAGTQEVYQDAAEAYSTDGSQPDAPIAAADATTTTTSAAQESTTTKEQAVVYQDYSSTLQRPATTTTIPSITTNNSAGTTTNPYEDAIREALDLLRKHRPPSPSQQLQSAMTDHTAEGQEGQQQQHLAIDMNVVHGATSSQNLRTPRDADRVLQSRYESPHHSNQEELDARRKERQERMARYTSRLAEIKGGEDGGAGGASAAYTSTGLHRPASTIEEDEDESHFSADPSTALDELVASASYASQPRGASHSPTASYAGSGVGPGGIPASCPSGDLMSLGAASSLSGSHYNPQGNQKEVHRSVERVLLAILERAHSNGRGAQSVSINASASNGSSRYAPEGTPDPSWQREEEKKSAPEDRSGNATGTVPVAIQHQQIQQQPTDEDDPLLRAVGELLSSSGGGSVVSSGGSPLRPSDNTEQSSMTSGAKRSVVEELLAEAESFGDLSSAPHGRKASRQGSGTQSLNEKPTKRGEDLLNCSTGVEAVRSDTDVAAVVVDKELDDLVLKTLGKSPSKGDGDNSPESSSDAENETGDNYEEETQTQSGSYEEDVHDSYDDEDTPVESEEDLDDALEGVLGPLSKMAGGTTGVVLESNFEPGSPARSSGERSIFDSLSNAMSSLVASAISGDEKHALPHKDSKTSSVRDKYATGRDSDEACEEVAEQSSGTSDGLDEEASELMRTLCAHLLPFGVDQSSRFLDEVPHWDDTNPNEAGYRIIRLTNLQLQRVERAFEAMVLGLKKHSEQNLIAASQPEAGEGDVDATFERDLAVAEKALDREEENRTVAIMKALKLHPDDPAQETEKVAAASKPGGKSDNDSVDASVASAQVNKCHPDFPGVHTAGKGEMGDLEYFHLPVIFKSHVTGFEPTKDLFLEQGNVVAGQYLVESELGSAAFSTAYRCVDLNSEGDDTEDGHQEVCLKVIKNTKDFFDQSLDEIKILELLRQTGKCQENNIIEMKTFFYHREHLIIVTELLRQNLFEFGKFILDHDEEPYFTLPRLGYIARQCLVSLSFVHTLGLVHSDVKPENILLGSYSRAQAKLIDFGSSCYLTDRQSSYIQSRSYRAPEVVLGLPYDGKIDVWSLGCVVAEMLTGEVTFQNDSIVSMLSRIEAICGPFPRHMIAQGRQSCRFFTKCGLLFEKVAGEDGQKTPDVSEDEADESDAEGRSSRAVFDIFQPKVTSFASRLGFPADLHDRYKTGARLSPTEERQAQFVDFVKKTLTIDPDSRPSAAEALQHPWMLYAASLSEEDIKYPSA